MPGLAAKFKWMLQAVELKNRLMRCFFKKKKQHADNCDKNKKTGCDTVLTGQTPPAPLTPCPGPGEEWVSEDGGARMEVELS